MRPCTLISLAFAGLVALACAGQAVAVPPAAHLLVPGVAIGPVRLGESRLAVEARLGAGQSASGLRVSGGAVRYPAAALTVVYVPLGGAAEEVPRVVATRVITTSARYRTRGGLGVGSSVAALRHAFARARCSGLACTLAGARGLGDTLFVLARGRVVRVEITRPLMRPLPVPQG